MRTLKIETLFRAGRHDCRPVDSLAAAARRMLDLGLRHLPVVNDGGAVIGIVSVRKLFAVEALA